VNLTIDVSEDLYRRAAEIAAAENVSVEELFAAAFEQRVLEFERLKDRAAKGRYEKFRKVMSKVPRPNLPIMTDSDYAGFWVPEDSGGNWSWRPPASANKLLTGDPKTGRTNQYVLAPSS
jgi:hypothetical protein